MLSSKLRLRRAQIPRIPIPSRWYNWGNYDASSGECCKMRDKDATACKDGKWFCPVKYEPNKCYKKSSFGVTEYPQYLQEIYNRGKTDPDCLLKLIRHDTDHYKPSDKSRKFQRTWPECPLLWLRPKDTCCPNPEIYMPMDRRIRPPQEPPLSAIDKHLFQMSIFCNAVRAPCCKVGRRPPNCTKPRRPSECCKKCTPMPSFSEACRHLIPRFCGSECACRGGSLCEMWNTYNKCNKTRRSCMKPFIGQGFRSSAIKTQGFRSFASKVTYHADPPCQPADPLCHHVPSGRCVGAREVLALKLPHEKLLQQEREQEKERKCCVLRSAAKNPCPEIRRPEAPKPEEKPFRSMWEPPCRADEQPFCKEMLPRFDAMYYHPSKKCRCYQRTWVECAPVKRRLKKVCCLDAIDPPEILYRIRPPCPGTCAINYKARRLLCEEGDLERDPMMRCRKFFHPCCKLARCNPRCTRGRKPTKCTRLRAPYRAFSEIGRWKRPLRKRECLCLETIPKCIALRERMRRGS